MTNPEIGPIPKEKQYSPEEFAEVFADHANQTLAQQRGQRLGNDIVPYEPEPGLRGILVVRQSPSRGRVTFVKRIGAPIPGNPCPITHEIHFPSCNPRKRDFRIYTVAFARNTFDSDGKKINVETERFQRYKLSTDDKDVSQFIGELFEQL